jgi:hypothetical protein
MQLRSPKVTRILKSWCRSPCQIVFEFLCLTPSLDYLSRKITFQAAARSGNAVANPQGAFAGIWDTWEQSRQRSNLVRNHHYRGKGRLDPKTDRAVLTRMLKPFPSLMMRTYPISSRVSSPDNETADLLAPLDTEVGQTLSLFWNC